MSNKVTIAISAALLFAAAATAASAAGSRASTTDGVIAAVCNELPPLRKVSHCGAGPHCQHFNISDRTSGRRSRPHAARPRGDLVGVISA
jgi:hypothetical protein